MIIKQEAIVPINGRIEHTANFRINFKAEMELELLDISYKFEYDFGTTAEITVVLHVYSEELDAYMRYISEIEADLNDSDSVVLNGYDFGYSTRLEDSNNELLHKQFLSNFQGTILFDVV